MDRPDMYTSRLSDLKVGNKPVGFGSHATIAF